MGIGVRPEANGEGRVGWFCTYTPIEVPAAAGLVPVRLFGAPGKTEAADSILGTNMCPYIRACLEEGLGGGAPRALIFAGCCDNLRRLYDAWSYYCDPEFVHLLDVPRGTSEISLEMFRLAVDGLLNALEEYAGKEIGASSLAAAMAERRDLDSRLERLAEAGSPGGCASGEARLREFMRAQTVSFEGFKLEGGSPEGSGRGVKAPPNRRPVVVTGNIVRPGKLLEVIESCGGAVVSLDLCSAERFIARDGTSPIDIPADTGLEELELLLARQYLLGIPCPRMLNSRERHDRLVSEALRMGARGVIVIPLMFCDPFLYDTPALERRLEAEGIPALVLQSDYQDDNIGQVITRVEAFMEML